MRRSLFAVGATALLMVLVGCSSSPAATEGPGGGTQAPGGATQAPGGATQAPGGATGTECASIPTFSISNPVPPSFPPDPTLEAHFPATIDGQPVTDVTSERFVDMLCAFGGQTVVDQENTALGSGFNLAEMSFGDATATVDGDSVDLTAFRTPNADANGLVQYIASLAALSGSTSGVTGTSSSANIGGKNVLVWTDSDGNKSYAYASGDTVVFFDSVTDDEAAKILTALP